MHTGRLWNRAALLLAALLTAALLLPCLSAPAAAAEPPNVVRVGYFYNGDFMNKDGDGYSGYDVEYYYTLAGYAGWDVRFVEFDSLQPALDALKRGDIDVMSGLSKTSERVSSFLVSSRKMCTAHIAVQTRADDDRFAAGDTATMTDMTCGILRGSNVVKLYTDWCAENGLKAHVVEYDSLQARNDALAAGEVDAIAGGSTIKGAQKIAEFPSLDLYFMFNRDRGDLKAQLDRAMGILALEDPTYMADLFARYFPLSRNDAPSFSAEEKAFIAAHPVIRVALLADDEPFSSARADGTVRGILPDYFAHLSEVVGAEFRCVPCASKNEAAADVAAGRADLMGKLGNDVFDAHSRGLILTVPYLRMNLVQITRVGSGAASSAAVPQCNAAAAAKALAAAGLKERTVAYANSERCFAALLAGRADAAICTQPAATWLLNRYYAADYTVSAFGGEPYDVACALPGSEDGNTLRAILDKTVAADNGYINQLLTSGTLEDTASLAGLFERLPVSFLTALAAVALALLIVAVAALAVLIRRRRAERRLAARQAQLAAEEEANKARHAFFGTVSHDMRTPLNGILGFTDLALASDDPEKVRDYLTKIRASGEILGGLVNDTLVMSRMENGKYTLKPAPCSTAEILNGILGPVRAMAEKKGVSFVDRGDVSRPRYVMADRLSLQKIILNLLSNAVKFTPPGGTVTLDCRLDPAAGEGGGCVIAVSDTGEGISKEFLPHIFEPFAQENGSNADASGSGLGLSIVRSIVDAMGGTIDVRSEKGRGSTFTVRLHLEEIDAPPEAKAPGGAAASDRLRGKRALVCEDNALNLEIVRSILERCGAEVTGAENGLAGVEAFERSEPGRFDVVLLDLRMPVMDGMAAAQAIRALSRPDAAAVPIYAVSADAYPENVAACLAAGMNGHIAKPIDAENLIAVLAEAVAR